MAAADQQTLDTQNENPRAHHVCPWWMGFIIASPLRKMGENPEKILAPLVGPGMTAVDIGSAMGFFSLPLARMVGGSGRVICVDVQERMLSSLVKRARRKGLDGIIETRLATQESLELGDLEGTADLALAIHVVHEAAYPQTFLTQCRELLKPGGKLLVLEPKGHVSKEDFEATRQLALDIGFLEADHRQLKKSLMSVLEK